MASVLSIREVADELASMSLENPYLRVLDVDPALVEFLLFQPQAVVVADATRVGVRDSDLLTKQMKKFLRKAHDAQVDVALCPEYSCTWQALNESVESNVFPNEGKLWVVACESATREQLEAAIAQFEQSGCKVVFDSSVWATHGNFVGTICYLFKTHQQDGASVDTILMQFKTNAMGGTSFEYENLKTGDKIYRFRNTAEYSGKLVAFICSDALHPEFDTKIAPQLKFDTFVLHPQMNTNPSSPGFCAYRRPCCDNNPRTTEVLTLNWAGGTKLEENGRDIDFIKEPKSIWFRGVDGLKLTDAQIMANHDKGCYLTHWNQYTAAYLFSPDPYLYLIQTTKPFVRGAATNALRTGPKMLELLGWDSPSSSWTPTKADDQFQATWRDPYPETQPILSSLLMSRYLDAERLIQLSVGEAKDINWVEWNRQPSFKLASDDTSHRLTLCRSNRGEGSTYRDRCLAKFRCFSTIVNNPAQFSIRLAEFRGGGFSVDHATDPLHQRMRNLHFNNTHATGIFVDSAPPENVLREVKKRTIKALMETESDNEKIAIWYRDTNGQLHDYMDQTTPQITDDPNAGPVAIDNPRL